MDGFGYSWREIGQEIARLRPRFDRCKREIAEARTMAREMYRRHICGKQLSGQEQEWTTRKEQKTAYLVMKNVRRTDPVMMVKQETTTNLQVNGL